MGIISPDFLDANWGAGSKTNYNKAGYLGKKYRQQDGWN
jgi:hypothetical protein